MARELKVDDVRAMLAEHCKKAGSQAAFASRHGVSREYVRQVLAGERPPGDKLCEALGIREDGLRWVSK